jgi:H+-transporting ATPase
MMAAARSEAGSARDVGAVLRKLNSSEQGLTQVDAEHRLETNGYNEIEEKSQNPLLKLLGYFWGPIPWMIEAAAALSAAVADWTDFGIIFALLVLNALVGYWEEFQADNAIAALKENLAVNARVRRDGAWRTIPARQLVPGDFIRLRFGDIVPADAVLLAGDELEIDQSALTGESLPVSKGTGESVYSGSIVRKGELDAVVSATGHATYFGKTAALVEDAHTTSHFQRAILKIGDYLIFIALALAVVILVAAWLRHDQLLTVLRFVLVLTVAAIPVAMPTVLSVTLAAGARILARGKAVVRRLAAIEELAGADVLCCDKTGTLTRNDLEIGDPFLMPGATAEELFTCAALASRTEDHDPIDDAVLAGAGSLAQSSRYQLVHFQPFDPVSKRTEAVVKSSLDGTLKVTKGAPQVILALAANAAEIAPQVKSAIGEFASRGFRSLGVARTEAGGQWRFLGLLPLFDPPREDSRATIAKARDLGVSIKMITGDQMAIAQETARQLGLGTRILDAQMFASGSQDGATELRQAIDEADGFAEVFPEHKYHVVEALQGRNHIVGMTGDGVNDAPALKQADVGIAVSGATDAARAAADIVLLAPGLSLIVDAIAMSRKIFQRMQSYATYRIAETIRVLLFMTLSILVFNFYPVTAVMIVLLALLNDGAILSIAYDRVQGSSRPEAWNMPMVLGVATVLGVVGVCASFGLFYLGDRVFGLSRDTLQSLMYLKLSVAGHMTVFVARTRRAFWSSRPSWLLLGAVIGTQLVATLIAVYGLFMTPIGWAWAARVWVYCTIWFVIADRAKLVAYRFLERLPMTGAAVGAEPAGRM